MIAKKIIEVGTIRETLEVAQSFFLIQVFPSWCGSSVLVSFTFLIVVGFSSPLIVKNMIVKVSQDTHPC